MMFKLDVGSLVKLNEVIKTSTRSNDWKTGFYRVVKIHAPFAYTEKDRKDPRRQSYSFEKIKKDGTVYKNFSSGYNCLDFDRMIEIGSIEIVENF